MKIDCFAEPDQTAVDAGTAAIPVLIVGFKNPVDITACLRALARIEAEPPVDVYICENGGCCAFNQLVAALTAQPDGPCDAEELPPRIESPLLVRVQRLRLRVEEGDARAPINVHIGEAHDNIGYAGGINAFLKPLLDVAGWPGIWVLNPDTEPAADALRELVAYAALNGKGMVGSSLRPHMEPEIVQSRGLAWRKWRAATLCIDGRVSAIVAPPPDDVERRMDAPCGASMYVTRPCIDSIGLMDERYFLYFEDLEWGLRAKRQGAVGYAHRSVVIHEGGTTIGSGETRCGHSPLAVYLDFRNRLLFVRHHFAPWLAWTFFIELAEIADFGRLRAFGTMAAAARGMVAGLLGKTGRPDGILRAHLLAAEAEKL